MSFDQVARKHIADKSSTYHGYMPHYERYLKGMDVRGVLEIGVAGGESMRMWCELFPNARIVGVDIDPRSIGRHGSRAIVEIIDQTDEEKMADLVSRYPAFDLIVDDGSHLIPDSISTLESLWPALASGGVYVAEDLYCNQFDETVKLPESWRSMTGIWNGFCKVAVEFCIAHAAEVATLQVVRSQVAKDTSDGQCLVIIKKAS